ncbi:MAG: pyruvate, phosphate dikinase [Planctomycetes bacterium]|nr:pyruvate, phosphate dikinase [Planctomycetota bacterium]
MASTRTPSEETSNTSTKMVYFFGKTRSEGDSSQKQLLGGKGANLAEMSSLGLPVPPGFTITTEVCADYYTQGQKLPDGLTEAITEYIGLLEKETGKIFGANESPLLVSVRSGAAVSMPGMMDTVLNLGLTDQSVKGLAQSTGNERFAFDAYRRLINMFGDVVMGLEHEEFEAAFDAIKKKYNATQDTDVPTQGMSELCDAYKAVYKEHTKSDFPQDPFEQLTLAVEAVFKSWHTSRAVRYREINQISGLKGTAVNVQAMVFGNMGDDCGTGVAFTRNPSTGTNVFYGEFLINAQGEDVVAGIRTPRPVEEMRDWKNEVYEQLLDIKNILEKHYREMQDIEFTIENSKLFMLQTRSGKRTGAAAVKIAVDLVNEQLITKQEALKRIPAEDLTQLLLPSFSDDAKKQAKTIATGLPASPGAATGKLAFSAEEVVKRTKDGESVLLVRKATSPEDIDGMNEAAGILTSTGGMTSHAAVVARGWGKCCVAGAGDLHIDPEKRTLTVNGKTFTHDDVLSIDGSTGEIMVGEIERSMPKLSDEFETVMKWADEIRTLDVRTNADTPEDAQRARDFGAQGIGLCRTEHMFFEGDRIIAMREMILADNEPDRKKALDKLLPYQRSDFEGIFKAMNSLPVTIRLLDPPLHEFLPHDEKAVNKLAEEMNVPTETVQRRVAALHEMNPMLGHRGCRLAITYPEILTMQVTAIVQATIACKNNGVDAQPEIMIPLVGTRTELASLRQLTEQTINDVVAATNYKDQLDIPIGTMIEIPRAALTADAIAEVADFFSFGTNDLTQLAFGYSRDDINTFLPDYLEREILEVDPFQSLDESGVGILVEMACKKGRETKPDLKLGICGEHGGDPSSILFFHKVGLDYVSCSPFRVPIARLVAAQATLG